MAAERRGMPSASFRKLFRTRRKRGPRNDINNRSNATCTGQTINRVSAATNGPVLEVPVGPRCPLAGRTGCWPAAARARHRAAIPAPSERPSTPVGGRLMHLESGKLSPAFWMSLWRPVEAADGAAGGCSSTSPLPTLRESMMPGAHTRAQCSAHVSHFFAVAFDMFMVCECRFAHASALDS